ncbi:rubrerythrin family protein [Alphaproteobacteria bacterium]|nr:rubrerythrin family protein [Alphaproteobacteria bacterium]
MFKFSINKKHYYNLSDIEILALAISSEEEDARIYQYYASLFIKDFPETASMFQEMSDEENVHRRQLIDLFKNKFGNNIPLIKREHVQGFYTRRPIWLIENLTLDKVRQEIVKMEKDAANFYFKTAQKTADPDIRKLLGDLAEIESKHSDKALLKASIIEKSSLAIDELKKAKKQFILTWVQPGLAGLMDGSVSTLAPIFATAFATKDSHTTLLVGLAASIGAGISMGFTEAAHDDGIISGRGSPIKRGVASGVMTTLGGLGHALPYLISDFYTATIIAMFFVLIELWAIAWIQKKYMEIKFSRAIFQVVFGGALVLAAGIFIGGF